MAWFELHLEENVFQLHDSLKEKKYQHSSYYEFVVCDPKRRHIHKACVHDRIVQQALFQVISPIFDKTFIYDSFSSRIGKGTHFGVARLERGMRKVTKNWKVNGYVLKCDIKKFFDSIDHALLKNFLCRKVFCPETQKLIELILESFGKSHGKGLPLGNVTSQLFSNIYLNELDQYVKHVLKRKYYFRYCDDFVILGSSKEELEIILRKARAFLQEKLLLELHPRKVEIRKIKQGIDFLGYVVLPHHRRMRTKTKKRILRNWSALKSKEQEAVLASYIGILGHAREREFLESLQKKRGFEQKSQVRYDEERMKTTITNHLKLERPLIIFDLETTGLSPQEDRILEIAYERIMPDGTIEAKVQRLNPGRDIPEDASRINGIYWEDVKDCPTFATLAFELWSMFEDADVGGFNVVGFDLPFLKAQFSTVGKNFDFNNNRKILDAKVLYHAKEPRDMFAPRNLTAAYKLYCGKDHVNAHTGDADVRATIEILEVILEKYPEFRNWDTIREMHGNKNILETVKNEHASLEDTIAQREQNCLF